MSILIPLNKITCYYEARSKENRSTCGIAIFPILRDISRFLTTNTSRYKLKVKTKCRLISTHIEFKNIASKTDERRFISRLSLSGIPHLSYKSKI